MKIVLLNMLFDKKTTSSKTTSSKTILFTNYELFSQTALKIRKRC